MEHTQHISIDLETLGTTRNAVILSVALVTDTDNELHIYIDIDEQLSSGRQFDVATLRWWMQQNDAALQRQADAERLPVTKAIRLIQDFFEDHQAASAPYVWGNAPSFDCEILASFLGSKPWPWYRERDVRTARMVLGNRTQPETAHDALADARAQLADVFRFMELRPPREE